MPTQSDTASSMMAQDGENEPLFILRGTDPSAPLVVMEWIRLNFNTASEHKLRSAFGQALLMRDFPSKKQPD